MQANIHHYERMWVVKDFLIKRRGTDFVYECSSLDAKDED